MSLLKCMHVTEKIIGNDKLNEFTHCISEDTEKFYVEKINILWKFNITRRGSD